MYWALLLGLLVFSMGCGLPAPQSHVHRDARWVGQRAPELAGKHITGEGPRTLAEAAGRVVVVEFWSTYCDPCERSFPRYQRLTERFGDAVAIIAVSLDDAEQVENGALLAFAKRTGATFPLIWGGDEVAKDAYDPPNLPTSFVIDQHGVIVHVHVKYEAGDADRIERQVEELLTGKGPTATEATGGTRTVSPPRRSSR